MKQLTASGATKEVCEANTYTEPLFKNLKYFSTKHYFSAAISLIFIQMNFQL